MLVSCAVVRLFATDTAFSISPLRLEVAEQHDRVGQIAQIDVGPDLADDAVLARGSGW